MSIRNVATGLFVLALILVATRAASSQSFRVQCPTSTITHPDPTGLGINSSEPAYTGPTTLTPGAGGYLAPKANVNGAIKCQQISGGDGFATMADGTQTFMFSFGPLSGLHDIANGQPGTQFPSLFNTIYPGTLAAGDPATTDDPSYTTYPPNNATGGFMYNGAVGLAPDLDANNGTGTANALI